MSNSNCSCHKTIYAATPLKFGEHNKHLNNYYRLYYSNMYLGIQAFLTIGLLSPYIIYIYSYSVIIFHFRFGLRYCSVIDTYSLP